jgi:hypothetical protein
MVIAMTDPGQTPTPPADPTSVVPSDSTAPAADPNAPQKSPLDILEEILGDAAKSGAAPGAGAAPGTAGSADAPAEPPKPQIPAEPQISPEELAAKEAAQKAKDEADILQKQAELQTITQTPEYHARVEQNAAAEASAHEHDTDGQGFEIIQLEHKKLPDVQVQADPVPAQPVAAPVEPVAEPVPSQPT